MNTIYRLYLIVGAILAILMTMYMFTNVYAQEPQSVFRQLGYVKDTKKPKVVYMTDEQYEEYIYAVTDACLRDLELPPPPAKMDRIQRREYLKLVRDLEIIRKQMFLSPPEREVIYTKRKVTPGIIASKPPATTYQGIFVVPPPPGWNINETYIPSYDKLWQLRLKEQRLRSNQRPTKSQRFRSAPKGDAFRR